MNESQLVDPTLSDYEERAVKRIKHSRLPPGRTLRNFDQSTQKSIEPGQLEQLANPDWLDLNQNLFIGGPSAAGKTHLAAALGMEWCWGGRHVLFSDAAQLVARLSSARPNLQQGIRMLDRYDALIIDDLASLTARSERATELLIQLLQHRSRQQRNVVVTSSLQSFQWEAFSMKQNTATQLLELLSSNAIIIELRNCCLYPQKPKRT